MSSNSTSSYLLFSYGSVYCDGCNYRSTGLTVRPVISRTTNIIHPKSSINDTRQAIYNIYGIKVTNTIADMSGLPYGIYIQNGKKVLVK